MSLSEKASGLKATWASIHAVYKAEGGAVAVEYVVLLGTCAIAIASAIVGWGPALLSNYSRSQGIILGPFP